MKFWKILVPAFVCVVLAAFLPTTARAATEGAYDYEVRKGEAIITDYDDSISGKVTIPATLGGYPVTTIDEYAFGHCDNMTAVVIPEGVVKLAPRAFYWSDSLTSVTFPGSLRTIGYEAFMWCDQLTSVTIPEGVTTIEYSAFENCTALTTVSLPSSLEHLGGWVFLDCDNLTLKTYDNAKYLGNSKNPYLVLVEAKSATITQCKINASTKIIDNCAFQDCYKLTTISIPGSVRTIGSFAFSGCYALKSATINSGVQTIYEYAFEDCIKLTSVTVPEGVTYLGHCLFEGCTALKTAKLPTTITYAGSDLFDECTNMTYTIYGNARYVGNATNAYTVLVLADSTAITQCQIHPDTKVIAEEAFYDCANLTSLAIPEGVITVGDWAFAYCRSLKTVSIPNSITNIYRYAFSSCGSMEYNAYDNALYLGNEANPYLVLMENTTSSIKTCQIHPNTKVIADAAFYNCNYMTSVTIPASVTHICDWAFSRCTGLTDVYYGSTAAKWKKVSVGDENQCLLDADFHFAQAQSGDMDGDGELTIDDAIYLLLHVMFGDEDYPLSAQQTADTDGDGVPSIDDAIYLLLHVMFGEEDYPL